MRPMKTDDTTTDHLEEGVAEKILQEKILRIVSVESSTKLYCCYGVIVVLTVSVIALSVALSVIKTVQISIKNICAACQRNWIGFGKKCFYFSENSSTWTSSQTFCIAQEAQLAQFDNLEELTFLKRYMGPSSHWIGLHRVSSKHPWMWTDNTEYNNSVSVRGDEKHGFLIGHVISSSRDYVPRKWICSKSSNCSLQCQ
ncbi:C-type lectin domain family 2 member F-like isoform X4 [Apodemus sylvaticus]|uniref:C-type lectin domain family 2 member F-like isoform X4 n=1 Tax=Apodemus sylvaticus TaxID=10129 RepID=UPI002244E30D|nr:C-type lectin domain family 2 member F-like isoform X4 [Apodemus sylvaticus]